MPTSVARKAPWCALSTTAPMSLWDQRDAAAASWWRPIRLPRTKAASVAPARVWSTNSFSPISRKMASPPLMSWPSTCIVARVPRCLLMKMTNRTRIAGVVMHPAFQEAWHIVCQWIWNVRLELGHQLEPTPLRTTEFASAIAPVPLHTAPASGYAPPQVGLPWKAGRFSGQDFPLQPDGTLRCPAGQELRAHEQRREADGSQAPGQRDSAASHLAGEESLD